MQVYDRSDTSYRHADGYEERYSKISQRVEYGSFFLYFSACIVLFLVGSFGVQSLVAWKFQTQCPAHEILKYRGE